ncbi:YktB family protein [Niallia sp. 03133]|uniref:YktB family protein n=1 Tax=Niallia sp. 03133 TaxID=3458060 RepID=UPI004043E1BB
MQFEGFNSQDFNTFTIDGLDERMRAIQERIQPKFQEIGRKAAADLSVKLGNEIFLHIARHARRTVNPPKDTWLALAANKRGYKQHPHFQIGLFDDHVFIWLAYIYELPHKKEIAETFLKNMQTLKTTIPNDFVISLDHMKKGAVSLKEIDLENSLARFRDVKKAEFLVGRHIEADDAILADGKAFMQVVESTFDTLLPLYQLSIKQLEHC